MAFAGFLVFFWGFCLVFCFVVSMDVLRAKRREAARQTCTQVFTLLF